MNKSLENSYRTAIVRKKPSRPTTWLIDCNLVRGAVLDYGCGHAEDAAHFGFDTYDPHFKPRHPERKYDTIICNFVLNTLEHEIDRCRVIGSICSLLKPGGWAYITVRRDVKVKGFTSRGTYQENIDLAPMTIIYSHPDFRIYGFTN